MVERASTELSVMHDVRRAIDEYEQVVQSVQDMTARRLSEVGSQVADEVRRRRQEVEEQTRALQDCLKSESRDCSALSSELRRRRDRLSVAETALRSVHRATASLQLAMARLGRESATSSGSARAHLTRALADASEYLSAGSVGGSSGEGRHSSGTPLPRVAGAPGIHDVDLQAIDSSDREIAPDAFNKGYSVEDLKWAFHALHEVVLPALASGLGEDYFRQRDAREARQGVRSYSDTFSGFLGGDAICLAPRNGSYTVVNGYHRIWVAREMGLSRVPARVV